jgi:hypothetical protein
MTSSTSFFFQNKGGKKMKLSLCLIKNYSKRSVGEWRYSLTILDLGNRQMLVVNLTPWSPYFGAKKRPVPAVWDRWSILPLAGNNAAKMLDLYVGPLHSKWPEQGARTSYAMPAIFHRHLQSWINYKSSGRKGAVVYWLGRRVTSRKVEGSRPYEVNEAFQFT